jgi:anti-sigma factor RsiW
MNCELVERDLDAYIDRELDVEAVASVRDHVNDCQICRHRVAEREAIGRLVRSVPYYSAPDRLRGRVVQGRRQYATSCRGPLPRCWRSRSGRP